MEDHCMDDAGRMWVVLTIKILFFKYSNILTAKLINVNLFAFMIFSQRMHLLLTDKHSNVNFG
jgi:hypothetical protein